MTPADTSSTAPSTVPRSASEPVAPHLRTGALGIAIRVVVAVATITIGNLAIAPVAGLVESMPALRPLGTQVSWAAAGVFAVLVSSVWITVVALMWVWVRFVARRKLRDI